MPLVLSSGLQQTLVVELSYLGLVKAFCELNPLPLFQKNWKEDGVVKVTGYLLS